MAVIKKNVEKKSPEKKPREPRKVKIKLNIDELDDAIVEGKLAVALRSRVLFERTVNKKIEIHMGFIHTISNGVVNVWDETGNRFFVFDLVEADKVKIKIA